MVVYAYFTGRGGCTDTETMPVEFYYFQSCCRQGLLDVGYEYLPAKWGSSFGNEKWAWGATPSVKIVQQGCHWADLRLSGSKDECSAYAKLVRFRCFNAQEYRSLGLDLGEGDVS